MHADWHNSSIWKKYLCKIHREVLQENKSGNWNQWDLEEEETMPVVLGALGLMNKELGEITSRISGNINTNEIQTKLETAHILRESTVAQVTFSSVTSEAQSLDPVTVDK